MSKSTSRLVNNIKQDLLKDELLAKSFEEYKSKNDTIINSKPLVLTELIDSNAETHEVDDGHLMLDEIAHSEEVNSAEILVLKEYVEEHKEIEEVRNEPGLSASTPSQNDIRAQYQDEITKAVHSLHRTTNDRTISEGLEKFDTLDEARQFIKNHFQNDLQNFLKEHKEQIDEICKKFLVK